MKSLYWWVVGAACVPVFCLAQEADRPLMVQDIQCRGNTATSCRFIASHLNLVAGDNVNEEEIQNAKLRLSSLSNFKSVDVHLEKGREKGRAIVVIEVSEASPFTKEIVLGTSWRDSSLSQKISGRVSHQNLFGSGKILDLEMSGRVPFAGPKQEHFTSRLQYVDPNLFGSAKYYLISGLSYANSSYKYRGGYRYDSEQLGADLSVGRRIWNFSYFSVGYQYRPISRVDDRYTYDDGSQEIWQDSYGQVFLFNYGWNSEDDAYFPTHGSRFNTSLAWTLTDHTGSHGSSRATYGKFGLGYRTTWTTGYNSTWTFKIGGTPGTAYRPSLHEDLALSLAFARPISKNNFGGIERGRWYIEPGLASLGYSSYSGTIIDPGLKAGIRLDTKYLGIVDIYAIATTAIRLGGTK